MKEQICCLCGQVFIGYGNNPYPLETPLKKCCDDCNAKKVIPARLNGVLGKTEDTPKENKEEKE